MTNEDIENGEAEFLLSFETEYKKIEEINYDKVKIGDKKYLRITSEISFLDNYFFKYISYIYIENGIEYMFAFAYDATQSPPIDIEEFLNNVKYSENSTLINEYFKIPFIILTVICYLIIPLFIIEHRKKPYSSDANILIISTSNFIIMIISFVIVPSKYTIAAALICGIITYHIVKQNHKEIIKKETVTTASNIQKTQNKSLQCQNNALDTTSKNEIADKNNDKNDKIDIEIKGKNNEIQKSNDVENKTETLENINDKLDKLNRLNQLKKTNTISDAEFELLKKEILGE